MKYLKVNKWFCLTHYHLISYWNNDYEHTCTSNQLLDSLQVKLKAYDGFVTSKKRSVEFQPSQWNSTKNEHSNLFVRSQKFFRTHKSKKKRSSEIRFETISYSHLASKFSFGEHPHQTLGRPKHPWALWFKYPKGSHQRFNGFGASPRSRHVLTYRLKQTMRQKTPSIKENLLLQYSNQFWVEYTFFFSSTKNILFLKQNNF